jgi:hypothetical protein
MIRAPPLLIRTFKEVTNSDAIWSVASSSAKCPASRR